MHWAITTLSITRRYSLMRRMLGGTRGRGLAGLEPSDKCNDRRQSAGATWPNASEGTGPPAADEGKTGWLSLRMKGCGLLAASAALAAMVCGLRIWSALAIARTPLEPVTVMRLDIGLRGVLCVFGSSRPRGDKENRCSVVALPPTSPIAASKQHCGKELLCRVTTQSGGSSGLLGSTISRRPEECN
jgi:hypothetical protein